LAGKRIQQLDGVRALAILAVLLFHSWHAKLLWMGVDLFFVLSGFLITGVLLDAKRHSLRTFLGQFYARRVRRILIPYVVFLAFASLFVGIGWMTHWYFYIAFFNFLGFFNIPQPLAFGTFWSLAVEEQFYLLWPFAVYFLSTRQLRRLCIFLMVLAPVLRGSIHFPTDWAIYHMTPFRMDLLAVGSFLCLEWRERPDRIKKWGTAAGILLIPIGAAGILLLYHLGYTNTANTRLGNVLVFEGTLAISVGAVLYALAGVGVQWLKSAPLVYIGTISYSLYLTHYLFLDYGRRHFGDLKGVPIGLAFTFAYAVISWHFLERKLLSSGSKKTKPVEQPATSEPPEQQLVTSEVKPV
jgi:peptidoglycan/LPS O-acetylase OafA/YrhL